MKYLLMIYENEAAFEKLSEAEQGKVYEQYGQYEGELGQSPGVKLAGHALKPTPTATTVRVRNGKLQTVDGPFAETKEQLGGYYLLECKNLDEAIKWAAKVPGAQNGSIEIRPILEFP